MTNENIDNENINCPSWINNTTLKEHHKEYNVYEYIGMRIYTTPDDKYFNATKLIFDLTSKVRKDGSVGSSNNMSSVIKSKRWQTIQEKHPELFKHVRGLGTQKYKGRYMEWSLFNTLLGTIKPEVIYNFAVGEPIDADLKGYIYACWPSCINDDDVIKFGRTWNWEQRVNGYGKGTVLDYLIPVDDMYLAEEKMLEYMEFLDKSTHGEEYFICTADDDVEKVIAYFEGLMKELKVENEAYKYKH